VELEPESSPEELFAQANESDYVAIQAFIDPMQEGKLQALIEQSEQKIAQIGADYRRQLQTERTVPDRALADRLVSRFTAANVAAPPGIGVFNLISAGYWRLARPLL